MKKEKVKIHIPKYRLRDIVFFKTPILTMGEIINAYFMEENYDKNFSETWVYKIEYDRNAYVEFPEKFIIKKIK